MDIEIRQDGVDESTERDHQFLPYPVVGIAGEAALAEGWMLSFRVLGSGVGGLPTPFHEGGRLRMSVRTVFAEALLRWNLTPSIVLQLGYQIQNWAGELRSGEDGDEFEVISRGPRIGFEIRW